MSTVLLTFCRMSLSGLLFFFRPIPLEKVFVQRWLSHKAAPVCQDKSGRLIAERSHGRCRLSGEAVIIITGFVEGETEALSW